MTRTLLWQEYRADHPDGYGYTWFCVHFEAWKDRASPTMRQSHAAGEKVFVDFAGDTIDVIDPVTGVVQPMKLFVAALGASSYIYAEARASEGLADWIGCHVGLFAFLGGVTAMIVCDNLKAAVTNPDRYDPGINRSYQEMARHYGTTVCPARPYKPRDKAKVEQSVLLVERWVLARLRNTRFFSLGELNAAVAALTADLNTRMMRGYAIAQTNASGEVLVKDSGAYGAFTINKAISIVAGGVVALVGTPGINITSGPMQPVFIHGLTININGARNTDIVVSNYSIVTLDHDIIQGAATGILTQGGSTVSIGNCIITSNTTGIYIQNDTVFINGDQISNNNIGVN